VRSGRHILQAFKPWSSLQDGKTLATCGLDLTIKLWNLETLAERTRIRCHGPEAIALSLSPDGKTLVTLNRHNWLNVWDIATGDFIVTLGPNTPAPLDLRFSPDGSTLATRVVAHGPNAVVHLWPAPRED